MYSKQTSHDDYASGGIKRNNWSARYIEPFFFPRVQSGRLRSRSYYSVHNKDETELQIRHVRQHPIGSWHLLYLITHATLMQRMGEDPPYYKEVPDPWWYTHINTHTHIREGAKLPLPPAAAKKTFHKNIIYNISNEDHKNRHLSLYASICINLSTMLVEREGREDRLLYYNYFLCATLLENWADKKKRGEKTTMKRALLFFSIRAQEKSKTIFSL